MLQVRVLQFAYRLGLSSHQVIGQLVRGVGSVFRLVVRV